MSDSSKGVFLSALTTYTYANVEHRKMLNLEEVSKFIAALRHARSGSSDFDGVAVNEIIVFSQYGIEEIKDLIENFEREEREAYQRLLAIAEYENMDMVKVDLTDFQSSYKIMRKKLGEFVDSGRWYFMANTGCGHKPGAMALLVATLNASRKNKKIVVKPFHTERGITYNLPAVNIEYEDLNTEYEKKLHLFEQPIKYVDAKKNAMKEGLSDREWERALRYLLKRKLVEKRDEMLFLTTRGRTLLALLRI